MKNCKTCGASLEDTASFCVMCGAKIEDGVQNDLQVPPVVNQINYDNVLLGEQAAASPREMFFKAVSSTKALITLVLLCVSFAIVIINIFSSIFLLSDAGLWSQMKAEFRMYNFDLSVIDALISIVAAIINIILVMVLVPSILNLLGVIFIFFDGKKRALKTRGLTLLKASSIYILVLYGLLALLLLLSFSSMQGGIIVALIALAIGLTPFVLVQICFINTANKLKSVVRSDYNLSISTFVPVIIIIFSGISALISLSSGDFVATLISLIGIVGNIMFAVCMFDYNNSIALMRVKNIYDKPVNRGNGL